MVRRRAFTLAELLVVIAIMALAAGLLFPVFQSAKNGAKRATCLSNMRQVHAATSIYVSDYDEYFMPVNHRPGLLPDSRTDRTWVQILLPYVKSFNVFTCPGDTSNRSRPETTFDEDLIPGDTFSQYYQASMRVNLGYNYLYLSPIVRRNGLWISQPKSSLGIANPSGTLLFVDSLWTRRSDGQPEGGGNWVVIPPCRYKQQGRTRFDSFGGGEVYSPNNGWNIHDPKSPVLYGNAWPWHSGRINVVRVDGSSRSMSPGELTSGCNVRDNWGGTISDSDRYSWDLD